MGWGGWLGRRWVRQGLPRPVVGVFRLNEG